MVSGQAPEEKFRAYLASLTVPYQIGSHDGKIHCIRKLNEPPPRQLIPNSILALEAAYLNGRIRRTTARERWRETRKLLSRYCILPDPALTQPYDMVPPKVTSEQRRERAREHTRRWRMRQPGYAKVPMIAAQ